MQPVHGIFWISSCKVRLYHRSEGQCLRQVSSRSSSDPPLSPWRDQVHWDVGKGGLSFCQDRGNLSTAQSQLLILCTINFLIFRLGALDPHIARLLLSFTSLSPISASPARRDGSHGNAATQRRFPKKSRWIRFDVRYQPRKAVSL